MPLQQSFQPAKIRKLIPRPSAHWSFSFRRWARPLCPIVDRFTPVLDRLERQRQTLHFVHAFIDLARYPSIKNPWILTDIVLPLYIRWLQQHLSPPDTQRPAAINAPQRLRLGIDFISGRDTSIFNLRPALLFFR